MIQRSITSLFLLGITVLSGRTARQTQHTLFSVFSFQIAGYELLLETQQSLQSVSTSVKTTLDDATSFFHTLFTDTSSGKAEQISKINNETLQEKVDQFRTKLIRLTWFIGALIGIIVWKILFDILFGLKQLRQRLHSFITE